MIREYPTLVLAALEAQGLTAYDGEVPDRPALPYVVAWFSAPLRSSDRITGDQWNGEASFQTTAVADSAEGVRWVQERVQAALVDARVSIPGRRAQRVKHDSTQPTRADRDVSPPVLYAVDTWSLLTVPG